ncbi:MAG: YjgP/YjgQ family permease [Chitinophagales bacterium]|jgi:lipopolysaccharide export system permease protein|nr:YjgP/YjgQ family permease [Chitinophagales bacterium]
MRKIDWYILKKFLVTFLFSMLLFTVVAVAVDISEKTDDFVKSGLSSAQLFDQYYIGFIPHIWSLLFPLFVFIAVIFFTSKMATQSEIIAILGSGTPYKRLLRPYWVGGLLLASLWWVGNRYWIPKANIVRSTFQSNYLDRNDPSKNVYYGTCAACFYLRIDSNTFVGIRDYDTTSKSARGIFLERTDRDRLVYNLRAESIVWDTLSKKWKLYRATERRLDSMGEQLTSYDTMLLSLNVLPEELRRDDYLKDKLTTPELNRFIEREEQRGTEGLNAMRVERYRRTSGAFSVLLLTLIGVIIATRKTRGGSGMHLAMGIIIASVFIISDRFSTVFAIKGNLPPLLAAWLPNLVFSLVALRMYRNTPK